MRKTDTFQTVKNLKAIHHRDTEGAEFYFVNSAYGAVNNKKLFSVPSVSLW